MSHFAYVAAAYAVAGTVIAALVVWAFLSLRAARRSLGELEARLGRGREEA